MMLDVKYRIYLSLLIVINFTLGSYFFASYVSEAIFHAVIFIFNIPFLFIVLSNSLRCNLHDRKITIRFFLSLIIIVIIIIGWLLNSAENGFGYFLMVVNCLMTFILVSFIINNRLVGNDLIIIDILKLLIIFLLLEAVSRILFPAYLGQYVSEIKFGQVSNMLDSEEGAFYYLKVLSYLRFDSNGVGIISFLGFSLSILACKLKIVSKYYLIIFFILVCLTLSRSAIVVSALFYLFTLRFRRIALFLPFLIAALFISLPFFFYGGSGQSKLDVVNNLFLYFNYVDIYQLLLGQGVAADIFDSNKTGVFGFFGHNLFVFLIFYIGLISIIPYLMFIYPIREANRYSVLYFMCILIIGMSYLRPFESFIFILTPFIYLLSNRLKNEKI